MIKIDSAMICYPSEHYIELAHAWFELGGQTYHTRRCHTERAARQIAMENIELLAQYGVPIS